jgi:chorismate mutase/prephenate dehydratase
MFLNSALKICGEVELRIHQHLMGRMKGMEKIERLCSHPQSLAQCRQWLDEHMPGIERIAVSSNAEAARRARDEEGTAAIAGQSAADVYGLNVIVPEIEDRPDNTTRFLVIGRKLLNPSGKDKTTLLVSTGDTQSPGSLHRLLGPFAHQNISLTRIESRPSRRRKWDYVFFIDVEGHADESPLKDALNELKEQSSLFKVLGSYPCAVV